MTFEIIIYLIILLIIIGLWTYLSLNDVRDWNNIQNYQINTKIDKKKFLLKVI